MGLHYSAVIYFLPKVKSNKIWQQQNKAMQGRQTQVSNVEFELRRLERRNEKESLISGDVNLIVHVSTFLKPVILFISTT